jgi:RNase H-like domain found in reverse transcriptase
LTSLTSSKVKFEWIPAHQLAFDKIKKVIETEILLSYPDFDKPFHIYTDASDHQLGAVIMQDKKPLAFYSRKLNSAQRRHTTERELLSTIETCKEYKNILLGYPIIVFTDHKTIPSMV